MGLPSSTGSKKPAAKPAPTAPRAQPKLDYKQERIVQEGSERRASAFDTLLNMFGGYDALNSNINARFDPTIPALMNSQMQSYANLMSGGPDINAMLSGNFASTTPRVPVTLGAGNGSPFDMSMQTPGMDEGLQNVFNNLITPTFNDQMGSLTQSLFQLGGPNQWDQSGKFQRPLPGLSQPTWESVGGQSPVMPQAPPPSGMMPQFKPVSSLPVQGPVAPANAPVQPPPAQKPGDMIPQYAMGTTSVPQTGLAVVHQGEQINPAGGQPPMQNWSTKPTPPQQTPQSYPSAGPTPQLPPPQPYPQQQAQPQQQPPTQNPIQQSIGQFSNMLSSGGPMNAQYLNMQNQQMADQTGAAYNNSLEDMRARMGSRGLGGSGLQYGMENDLFNGMQSALTQGHNQNAMNAATGNWNAMQQGAGNLMGASMSAGQFGLAQQAQQQQMQQSMFSMLLDALRQSQVNPNDLYGQQNITIGPTAA